MTSRKLTNSMNTKAQTGQEGESLAADYLESKGFSILEKNYRHKRSEIDLIVKLNNLLIFVEVKTKTNTSYGNPEIAIDQQKAAKVMEGADYYIQESDWKGNVRFDVISIIKKKSGVEIEHFKDAFY